MNFAERLNYLYALSYAQRSGNTEIDLQALESLDSATYLACELTFQCIQEAGRSPADERERQFDMLSVYQTFALLIYAYLSLPLAREGVGSDITEASIVIVKSIFSDVTPEEWVEIVDSGTHKFHLIAQAESEHWVDYRDHLEKAVVAYVIAGTDDEAQFTKEDIIPILTNLLSQLCEAFEEY